MIDNNKLILAGSVFIICILITSYVKTIFEEKKKEQWRNDQKNNILETNQNFIYNTIFLPIYASSIDSISRFIMNTWKLASCPERIFFGIKLSMGSYEDIIKKCKEMYDEDYEKHFKDNIILENIRTGELTFKMYRNEKFIYFLHESVKLKNGWDEILINQWNNLKNNKAILTGTIPMTPNNFPCYFILNQNDQIEPKNCLQKPSTYILSLFATRIGSFGLSDIIWSMNLRGNSSYKWLQNKFLFYIPIDPPTVYQEHLHDYQINIYYDLYSERNQDFIVYKEDADYLKEKYKYYNFGITNRPIDEEIIVKYGGWSKFENIYLKKNA